MRSSELPIWEHHRRLFLFVKGQPGQLLAPRRAGIGTTLIYYDHDYSHVHVES
jgi:hypothetical protein